MAVQWGCVLGFTTPPGKKVMMDASVLGLSMKSIMTWAVPCLL